MLNNDCYLIILDWKNALGCDIITISMMDIHHKGECVQWISVYPLPNVRPNWFLL